MAPRPKLHDWNGKELTVAQLAGIRDCSTENMHHLIRKYGFPEAMNVPQRTSKPRGKRSAHQPIKSAGQIRTAGFNRKLERWRRLKSWLEQGMSIEEIRIKESLI